MNNIGQIKEIQLSEEYKEKLNKDFENIVGSLSRDEIIGITSDVKKVENEGLRIFLEIDNILYNEDFLIDSFSGEKDFSFYEMFSHLNVLICKDLFSESEVVNYLLFKCSSILNLDYKSILSANLEDLLNRKDIKGIISFLDYNGENLNSRSLIFVIEYITKNISLEDSDFNFIQNFFYKKVKTKNVLDCKLFNSYSLFLGKYLKRKDLDIVLHNILIKAKLPDNMIFSDFTHIFYPLKNMGKSKSKIRMLNLVIPLLNKIEVVNGDDLNVFLFSIENIINKGVIKELIKIIDKLENLNGSNFLKIFKRVVDMKGTPQRNILLVELLKKIQELNCFEVSDLLELLKIIRIMPRHNKEGEIIIGNISVYLKGLIGISKEDSEKILESIHLFKNKKDKDLLIEGFSEHSERLGNTPSNNGVMNGIDDLPIFRSILESVSKIKIDDNNIDFLGRFIYGTFKNIENISIFHVLYILDFIEGLNSIKYRKNTLKSFVILIPNYSIKLGFIYEKVFKLINKYGDKDDNALFVNTLRNQINTSRSLNSEDLRFLYVIIRDLDSYSDKLYLVESITGIIRSFDILDNDSILNLLFIANNVEGTNDGRILLLEISKIIDNVDKISSAFLSQFLFSMQDFTLTSEVSLIIQKFLSKQLSSTRFSHISVINSLLGIENKGLGELENFFFSKLSDFVNKKINNKVNVIQSYKIYKLYGKNVPDILENQYFNHIEEKNGVFGSSFEKTTFSLINKTYPGTSFSNNIFIDGFELDFLFEVDGLKYNLETDGVSHNPLGDKKRDKYLEEKHDIKVFRCKSMTDVNRFLERLLG